MNIFSKKVLKVFCFRKLFDIHHAEKVNEICQHSKWPRLDENYYIDTNQCYTVVYSSALLGNQLVSCQDRDKPRVRNQLFKQLYDLITKNEVKFPASLRFYRSDKLCVAVDAEALEDCLDSSSGHPPQLEKVKEGGGKACRERSYTKLVKKIGRKFFKRCGECHHLNFQQYKTCL